MSDHEAKGSAGSDAAPVMIGMSMPDIDVWSDRVVVALGQNPSPFAGPGTNTYIVGTGKKRLLIDTGHGVPAYAPVLAEALERAGCGLEGILLTHAHPDHIGGVQQVLAAHGDMPIYKMPWPEMDAPIGTDFEAISGGGIVETEGATLRAIHTPGHAPDHLCFMLEEESSLFSGDNVLGVGTTVIPSASGDLAEYMDSLERMKAEKPRRIYPAHGPCIEDGVAKLQEYIDHRKEREGQVLEVLGSGETDVKSIVRVIYAAYPEMLHAAAGQSITSHLTKLEKEGRVARAVIDDHFAEDKDIGRQARWRLA